MIRTSFLLPKRFNDGSQIPVTHFESAHQMLLTRFGGYTIEGTVNGAWIGDDGLTYFDESFKYAVGVNTESLEELRSTLNALKDLFKQKAIYLEVGTEVEFI